MTKSYVSMEHHQCMVCLATYDTGSILMDTRLRDTFDSTTVTGAGLCPEHQKLYTEGYIALVELDTEEERTGRIAHLRKHVYERLFTDEARTPLVYASVALLTDLLALQAD